MICWLLLTLFIMLAFFKPEDTLKTRGLLSRFEVAFDVFVLFEEKTACCWLDVAVVGTADVEEITWVDKTGVVDTSLRPLLAFCELLVGLFGILLAVFDVISVPLNSKHIKIKLTCRQVVVSNWNFYHSNGSRKYYWRQRYCKSRLVQL